jgi:altronate dehydratase
LSTDAPVIKVSSTSELYEKMSGDIDVDAGQAQRQDDRRGGRRRLATLMRVARGEKTKANQPSDVFAIFQTHPAL